MPRWTFQQGTNNKWWGYDIVSDTTIRVKWGRIGTTGQEKQYDYGSASERDNWIKKKVREQEREGYKAETDASLAVKTEVAKVLGTRNTIIRTLFVRREENTLHLIGSYEPTQYVYCEVLDSYSSNKNKVMHRILLTSEKSFMIDGVPSEDKDERTIECDAIREVSKMEQLVKGVREYLKRIAQKVAEAAQRLVMPGERKLKLGLSNDSDVFVKTEAVESLSDEVFREVESEGGASRQVVNQLVGLGMRKLML
jgi:predicted DNA-binding WGR domain protein